MVSVKAEMVSWIPETDLDRERVQIELSSIIAGSHFRGSKRYPAFLRYVVERALDGKATSIKERTIGVDVFDRRPDYDTNADPVVRYSASEVRKRLAQHYHESQEEAEIQIELPLGCYVPEFRMRSEIWQPEISVQREWEIDKPELSNARQTLAVPSIGVLSRGRSKSSQNLLLYLLAAVLIALAIGGGRLYKAVHQSALQLFWGPSLGSSNSVLLVVGTGNLELKGPESSHTTLYEHMIGPYQHVSLSSAVAIARLTNVLQANRTAFGVKESNETSLTDIKERPVILVGALNNLWSLRLSAPLRFQFTPGPLASIVDKRNVPNRAWIVDFSQPYTSVTIDYAIVARYHNQSTNGNVILVGGLGPYGTEAASELISSPQYLEKISQTLPKGWQNRNIELVIKTDVIGGQAGPPSLVASDVW